MAKALAPRKSKSKASGPRKRQKRDDMSNLVLSLIDESAFLVDVLNCSLALMELFNADEIVDCVTRSFRKSCGGELRLWRVGDVLPVVMGRDYLPLPEDPAVRDALTDAVFEASEHSEQHFFKSSYEFLQEGGYVMEIAKLPENPYGTYVATLYFRHLTRALNNLKERLVIAKAFQEVREILDLKHRVEGSLQDIKDQSVSSIAAICAFLEEIIEACDHLSHEDAPKIQALAMQAINETQVGDLTNQKIFASLHNLDMLFSRLTNSLDPASRQYLESLYKPSTEHSPEGVVSTSILEGQKPTDQSAVDTLLAELGL